MKTVSPHQTGKGLRRYNNGKRLDELITKGMSLEDAMRIVGIKTKTTARGCIKYYLYYAAQQSTQQRPAFGKGPRLWLAKKFVSFGWWLAEIGSR
jgi:hypothetical protein